MNTDFVIEPKYDNGVGFIHLEESRKLMRHYEMDEYNEVWGGKHITLDVYEDGLIQCYEKYMSCSRYYQEHPPIISLIFTIELTNGEKINITLLELIDNIYSPFCEKKQIDCQPVEFWYGADGRIPFVKGFSRGIPRSGTGPDHEGRIYLFKETFQTLQTIKKLYDKIVIF